MSKMMIVFDMDGTIADLYSVENWLEKLRAFDPAPYRNAAPMWHMAELVKTLNDLRKKDVEIRIVTWLSKVNNETYKDDVRQAKKEWLADYNFPVDHFHGVAYGATKADSVRKYLEENEEAILIDDNEKIRNGWHLGRTIDPTSCDLIEVLKNLL